MSLPPIHLCPSPRTFPFAVLARTFRLNSNPIDSTLGDPVIFFMRRVARSAPQEEAQTCRTCIISFAKSRAPSMNPKRFPDGISPRRSHPLGARADTCACLSCRSGPEARARARLPRRKPRSGKIKSRFSGNERFASFGATLSHDRRADASYHLPSWLARARIKRRRRC